MLPVNVCPICSADSFDYSATRDMNFCTTCGVEISGKEVHSITSDDEFRKLLAKKEKEIVSAKLQ